MSMFRTFTETYDLNTEVGYPTVLGIHTPIGPTPYKMLDPAFRMYKKYKYVGCDLTIVNAARLPVDPEQVGKTSGTNYVSAKDVLDPILFKGCHGESLGQILESLYDGVLSNSLFFDDTSIDKEVWGNALVNFYYTALGDDSWKKSPVQKTLHLRNLHPLVYSVSMNHQLLPTNSLSAGNYSENNAPLVSGTPNGLGDGAGFENGMLRKDIPNGWEIPAVGPTKIYDPTDFTTKYKTGLGSMFTSKMHGLGWLDTYQFLGQNVDTSSDDKIALLPKCMMGILMLPPAHLCRQYLRVIIRHKFMFARYRTITEGSGVWMSNNILGYYDETTGNVSSSKEMDPDFEPLESDDLDC